MIWIEKSLSPPYLNMLKMSPNQLPILFVPEVSSKDSGILHNFVEAPVHHVFHLITFYPHS